MENGSFYIFVLCLFLSQVYISTPVLGSVIPTAELPVYFVPRSVDNYLQQNSVPPLSEYTICLWFKGVADDDNRSDDWLFSFSANGDDDSIAIGWWGENGMLFWITGISYEMDVRDTEFSVDALWFGWNKHCFTWKPSDFIKWYSDVDESGVLVLIDEVAVTSETVAHSGYLAMFQEQDGVGNFDLTQAGYGGLAWFNVWSYAMDLEELNNLGCKATGDIVSMDTLELVGFMPTWQEYFPCPDGELPPLQQTEGYNQWTRTFCKIPGGQLNNIPEIQIEMAETAARCANLCNRFKGCLSANFLTFYSACRLYNVTNQGNELHFDTNCGDGCVFLTTDECR